MLIVNVYQLEDGSVHLIVGGDMPAMISFTDFDSFINFTGACCDFAVQRGDSSVIKKSKTSIPKVFLDAFKDE